MKRNLSKTGEEKNIQRLFYVKALTDGAYVRIIGSFCGITIWLDLSLRLKKYFISSIIGIYYEKIMKKLKKT